MRKTYMKKGIPYSMSYIPCISLSIPNLNTQNYGLNLFNFRQSAFWNNLSIKFLKKCKFLQEF